jgi:hypothetical protein
MRFVQLTPPGSACSISIGEGIVTSLPDRSRACNWSSPTSLRPIENWSTGASK